jgi:ABC-type amino acid transport substrate-binding protein
MGIAANKNAYGLLTEINLFLKSWEKSPQYQQIYNYYFTSNAWMGKVQN